MKQILWTSFINPQLTDKRKDNKINLIYKILMQKNFLTWRFSAQKRR
jgi:hypothetical protein